MNLPIETPLATRAEDTGTRLAKGEHVLREFATVVGAASGVAFGVIAGPPGAVIGGAIGAAIGRLAGHALEDAAERRAAKERALDDAIGVTSGDLGARERASQPITALERRADAPIITAEPSLVQAGQILRAGHERLEHVYATLRAAYESNDWNLVSFQWNLFESALREDMRLEERDAISALSAVDPVEAAALIGEHGELRRYLAATAVAVDFRAVTVRHLDELLARIRAHAAREEQLFYPWLDVELAIRDVASAA